MRHVFIVNPKAGKGNFAQQYAQKVKARAEELKLDYTIHVTSAPYEAIDFVKQEAGKGYPVRF